MTPDDGRAMSDERTIDAVLDREREYIEQAALELCWLTRPRPVDPDGYGPLDWWRMQAETVRRGHFLRARVAIETWERCHAA